MNEIETLIGEQCQIEGNVKGSGVIKVDGLIQGDIIWEDDVILGLSAISNGNISCKSAYISGKIKGNIICENQLIIENCGRVSGDITVSALIVKEGGILDGKSTMVVSEKAENIIG